MIQINIDKDRECKEKTKKIFSFFPNIWIDLLLDEEGRPGEGGEGEEAKKNDIRCGKEERREETEC